MYVFYVQIEKNNGEKLSLGKLWPRVMDVAEWKDIWNISQC
jgi:hypothetical protein